MGAGGNKNYVAGSVDSFIDDNYYQFKNEKHLCNYIEDNIYYLCSDILNEKYLSHEREKHIAKSLRKNGKSKRIDLFIETSKGNVVCELKVPTDNCNLTSSISQVMSYYVECEKHNIPVHRYVIITNSRIDHLSEIVLKFKLPFDIISVTKKGILHLQTLTQ